MLEKISIKNLLKDMYKKGIITDAMLEDYEVMPGDIEDIKDERDWETLYDRIDYDKKVQSDVVVEAALGLNWKASYQYKEQNKRGKYGLDIKINGDEWNKIYEKAREMYESN